VNQGIGTLDGLSRQFMDWSSGLDPGRHRVQACAGRGMDSLSLSHSRQVKGPFLLGRPWQIPPCRMLPVKSSRRKTWRPPALEPTLLQLATWIDCFGYPWTPDEPIKYVCHSSIICSFSRAWPSDPPGRILPFDDPIIVFCPWSHKIPDYLLTESQQAFQDDDCLFPWWRVS